MKKCLAICGLAILLVLLLAPKSKADGIETFTYQSNGNTYIWQLPVSPTPVDSDAYPGWGFTLENIPVSVAGGLPTMGSFDFFSSACSGGFDLTFAGTNVPVDAYGPMLYTDPENAPVFLSGVFNFTDYGANNNGVPGTLVVATPEPSSIGSLVIGLVILAVFGLRQSSLTNQRRESSL